MHILTHDRALCMLSATLFHRQRPNRHWPSSYGVKELLKNYTTSTIDERTSIVRRTGEIKANIRSIRLEELLRNQVGHHSVSNGSGSINTLNSQINISILGIAVCQAQSRYTTRYTTRYTMSDKQLLNY